MAQAMLPYQQDNITTVEEAMIWIHATRMDFYVSPRKLQQTINIFMSKVMRPDVRAKALVGAGSLKKYLQEIMLRWAFFFEVWPPHIRHLPSTYEMTMRSELIVSYLNGWKPGRRVWERPYERRVYWENPSTTELMQSCNAEYFPVYLEACMKDLREGTKLKEESETWAGMDWFGAFPQEKVNRLIHEGVQWVHVNLNGRDSQISPRELQQNFAVYIAERLSPTDRGQMLMAIAIMVVYLEEIVRDSAEGYDVSPSITRYVPVWYRMGTWQALIVSCLQRWPCLPHELQKFWLNYTVLDHARRHSRDYLPSHVESCMNVLKWLEIEGKNPSQM